MCDVLGIIGAGLGVVAVVLALAVPAYIEWSRRPRLRVELGTAANSDDPLWRIVHVRVINEPLQGRLARFLLRNPASGCRVTMDFVSRSDGSRITARGKWSARLQPLTTVPVSGGQVGLIFDPERSRKP